jgi:hypothetical protein
MGAQPRKEEGDDDYASSERNEIFAASVAQTCVIPPYVPGTVDKDIEGDANEAATPDNSVDVARTKGLKALQRLSAVNLTAVDVEPADFEKDDDYNFHARSRRPAVPSRRRRDSSPSAKALGGLLLDFEPFRTALSVPPRRRSTS